MSSQSTDFYDSSFENGTESSIEEIIVKNVKDEKPDNIKDRIRNMKKIIICLGVTVLLSFVTIVLLIILVVVLFFNQSEPQITHVKKEFRYPYVSKTERGETHRGMITLSRELVEPKVVYSGQNSMFLISGEDSEKEDRLYCLGYRILCCKKGSESEDDCRKVYDKIEYNHLGKSKEDCKSRAMDNFLKAFRFALYRSEQICDEETEDIRDEFLYIVDDQFNVDYECIGGCEPNTFENFLMRNGGEQFMTKQTQEVQTLFWDMNKFSERGIEKPTEESSSKFLRTQFEKERDWWCDNELYEPMREEATMEEAEEKFRVEVIKKYCRVAAGVKPAEDRPSLVYYDVCRPIFEDIRCRILCPEEGFIRRLERINPETGKPYPSKPPRDPRDPPEWDLNTGW